MSAPAAVTLPHEMAPASVDSCLRTHPARQETRNATFLLFFFSFFKALIFLSLRSVPRDLRRALRKAVTWRAERRRGSAQSCRGHGPGFPTHLRLTADARGSAPRWRGASGRVQPGPGRGAPRGAKKSADSAGSTAVLPFQNFLPPLPKYKGTFVLNTEREHWWAPRRAPCGIWFLATVHVFIMMGEGKEGSCSYQHANNLLQRTGALRAN